MSSSVDEAIKGKMTEGHWPPRDVGRLNLSRWWISSLVISGCTASHLYSDSMRVYPHLQDSGGFFVAVLQRIQKADAPANQLCVAAPVLQRFILTYSFRERKREADEPAEVPESKRVKIDDDSLPEGEGTTVPQDASTPPKSSGTSRSRKKNWDGGNSMFKENPYTFLRPDDPILQICMWVTFSRHTLLWYKILSSDRLHITGAFPSSNILVRNPEGDAVRSLYLANDIVKAVIQNNNYEKIRLTTAGTKVFSKQEAGKGLDVQFRVLGEGLPVILPYLDPSSIITADIATLRVLVESYYPLCSNFAEPFRGVIQGLGVCHFWTFYDHNSSNLQHLEIIFLNFQ